jgi:surface antigen
MQFSAAVLLLAVFTSGCAYQMDSLFAGKRDGDLDTTGSIRSTGLRQHSAAVVPQERDLAAARAAMSEALGKGGRETSIPWEDPRTGARGTVTPLSNAYSQDGTTCRDFLASYVRSGAEAWVEGEACRSGPGGGLSG